MKNTINIFSNLFSARYIDNDSDEDFYLPNHYFKALAHRPDLLERYWRQMMARNHYNEDDDDETSTFQRRGKAITKGDPREFMG